MKVGIGIRLAGVVLLVGIGFLMLSEKFAIPQAARPARTAGTLHDRAVIAPTYLDLPLSFEPNHGQADSDVRFIARGPGYMLLLGQSDADLWLRGPAFAKNGFSATKAPAVSEDPNVTSSTLRFRLLGSNRNPEVAAEQDLPGKVNYLIGRDPTEWHTGLSTYARVRYKSVYRGIDLEYYGRQGLLECDFIAYPGSDPSLILLSVANPNHVKRVGERLRLAANGDLVASLAGGEVRLQRPVVYQERVGGRKSIEGRFRLVDMSTVGLELGPYDKALPLVIDPMLVYSTYLGGAGGDVANGIAVDSSSSAYLTGTTQSANFPTAPTTPLQSKLGGASNVFVTKFNAAGTALVYSTYLGGAGADQGSAIAVDAAGSAYVTGTTTSENFPTTSGALQTKYGGNHDAFVAKLSADGSTLEYSTYLGGSGDDFGRGIAIDSSGDAYVAGQTLSTNFPIQNPYQASCNVPFGGTCSDAFVSELNATGAGLVYSTYLGGSGADSAQAIAVDTSAAAYVGGWTLSGNFPVANALQTSAAGGGDAFVAKLVPGGSKLAYSTYLGGSGPDHAWALAVDPAGNAYVTGDTQSANFPVTPGVLGGLAPSSDAAFVAELNAAGSALVYSTYLGGATLDQGFGIAVEASGTAAVTGLTESGDFPTVSPFDAALGGGTCGAGACPDAFVARVSAGGSSLVYSSYLGGSGADSGQAIALDASDNIYVAGATASANFPAVTGAEQGAYQGSGSLSEAFVAKVAPADAAVLAASPQILSFGNQGVNSTSTPLTVTLSDAGSAPLTLSSFTASSGFAVAKGGTCAAGTVLQPGAVCTVNVVFSPTSETAATGTLTITDNAGGSPQTISLSGTGVAATSTVTLSATSLTFPATVVGSSSTPQIVTVTNSGSASLSITAVAVSGNYTETNVCGSSLAAGAACQVTLVFAPKETGSNAGTLTITDSAAGSPQKVSLTGTGVPVFSLTVTPPSAPVMIGATSATFSVTASAPATFSSQITVGCASGATCSASPATIAPGQTAALTVSGLATTTPNPYNFTVTGTINSGASNQQVSSTSVSLNFADVSLAASPPVAAIVAGQTATYSLTVSPLNSFNKSVSLSCSQTLQAATCAIAPASVTLNGSSAVNATVTLQTTKQSTHAFPRVTPGAPPWPLQSLHLWLVVAMLALLAGASAIRHGSVRSATQRWALLALVLVFVTAGSACYNYGFNVVGTGGVSGTQSGNYTVTLSATIGAANSTSSVVRSTTVNISVASSLGQ